MTMHEALHLRDARELKKHWNVKVTIILIVINAVDKVTKDVVPELDYLEITGRRESVQNTALLKSARILRRS